MIKLKQQNEELYPFTVRGDNSQTSKIIRDIQCSLVAEYEVFTLNQSYNSPMLTSDRGDDLWKENINWLIRISKSFHLTCLLR